MACYAVCVKCQERNSEESQREGSIVIISGDDFTAAQLQHLYLSTEHCSLSQHNYAVLSCCRHNMFKNLETC